ncbi:MAG: LacI family DNA-binding transcriptional regulator [Caldicoprobacterales bacterium]|jgi:LacI family transcriptional regulator
MANNNKVKRVTIKDIAKEAGVSAMAVSRVLSNKGGISRETSERILSIAKKMNYRPNTIARSLRKQTTKTIGVIASDSSELVFSQVLRGVQDSASAEGYDVIIANTYQIPENEKHVLNTMIDRRIDGLIFAAPMRSSKEEMEELKHLGIPVVLLMRSGGLAGIDSVSSDNYNGGYEIVDYLLRTRDTDIRFLALSQSRSTGIQRIIGHQNALLDHGRKWNEEHVIYCEPTIEDGYNAMVKLLKNGYKSGNVCCGCDLIAIGAIKAVQEAGIKIPEEIRISGYDDIELSDYLSVPLTTMRQPKYDIGYEGVRLLLERLQNPEMNARQIVLSNELIIRKST